MYFTVLDLLRFLSSVSVVFHHTFLFHYGRLSIYLFFMISGFVIYFSLQKGLKEYVIGRFLRLYPIFWVCASITFFITILYGTNISFKNYLIGLLMFNSGRMETMIDGSYWTLTFELLFYFYIGVFVWLFSTKKLEWFYIGWLSISFMAFYLKVDQILFFKLLSIRFAPYFVFGGLLALIVDRFKKVSLQNKIVYLLALTASALMPMYVSGKLQDQKETITNFTGSFDRGEMIIVELLFIVMILGVYFSYYSFAKNKTFSKIAFILGGITYPLYLLHWKIGDTIISGQGHVYGEVNLFSVFIALILVIISLILSIYDIKIRKYIKKEIIKY